MPPTYTKVIVSSTLRESGGFALRDSKNSGIHPLVQALNAAVDRRLRLPRVP